MSRDPLHGVTLKHIVQHLHAEYGWAGLAERIPVKCFQSNPSLNSSLKFLRRESWARERVEGEYVRLVQREDSHPLIDALKRGEPLDQSSNLSSVSQTKWHQALAWAVRHQPDAALLLELLRSVEDVTFWPESEAMPLLNLAVERSAPAAFVREVLRRGADPNDARFWLPLLHTADTEGQAYRSGSRAPSTEMLDLLLAHGAEAKRADPRGHTALDIAQAYGLKAFIHKL